LGDGFIDHGGLLMCALSFAEPSTAARIASMRWCTALTGGHFGVRWMPEVLATLNVEVLGDLDLLA